VVGRCGVDRQPSAGLPAAGVTLRPQHRFPERADRPREKRAVEFLGSSDLDFILATDDEEQFSRLERER
jgi:hypothetical protein